MYNVRVRVYTLVTGLGKGTTGKKKKFSEFCSYLYVDGSWVFPLLYAKFEDLESCQSSQVCGFNQDKAFHTAQ